jgi:hypothetical protein
MKGNRNEKINLLAALLFGGSLMVLAGPPFATDDPVPVDFQCYHAYQFTFGPELFRSLGEHLKCYRRVTKDVCGLNECLAWGCRLGGACRIGPAPGLPIPRLLLWLSPNPPVAHLPKRVFQAQPRVIPRK